METVDTDYMQQTSLSDINLSEELEDVLSNIISKLDVYDVINDGHNYSVINLKNNDVLFEDLNLRMVGNVIAAALNTGEEVSYSAIEKLIKYERQAVSKMVEINLYEELVDVATDYDQQDLYEIKLQEAELKCKTAVSKILQHARQIITS
jgi:hypothetical protein